MANILYFWNISTQIAPRKQKYMEKNSVLLIFSVCFYCWHYYRCLPSPALRNPTQPHAPLLWPSPPCCLWLWVMHICSLANSLTFFHLVVPCPSPLRADKQCASLSFEENWLHSKCDLSALSLHVQVRPSGAPVSFPFGFLLAHGTHICHQSTGRFWVDLDHDRLKTTDSYAHAIWTVIKTYFEKAVTTNWVYLFI